LIRKIIDLIHRLWSIPFFRFLVVGGVNTIFGYGVFSLLILLGLHYVIAALLATICGILFNFKTTGTLVFKNRDSRLIFRFFGVYLITYFLIVGLLKLLDMAGVTPLVAGAIIVLPMGVVSFLLMKNLVFKTFKQGLIK
jgi:putative flippase GtrA